MPRAVCGAAHSPFRLFMPLKAFYPVPLGSANIGRE